MDPVINSLVQSPLVRSMSTVPSKSTSFVHGVRDNVPPFSLQKVVVQPWNNPSSTSQDQIHKFRIPQFGTLNRAYLRIKTVNQVPTAANTKIDEADYGTLHDRTDDSTPVDSNYDALKAKVRIPWHHEIQSSVQYKKKNPFGGGGSVVVNPVEYIDPETQTVLGVGTDLDFAARTEIVAPENYMGRQSNAWNVINILDEIRLTTNGKLIETVYGETIPAEVIKMPQGLRDFYVRGMVGWAAGNADGTVKAEPDYRNAWDPTACHRDAYGRLSTHESQPYASAEGQVSLLMNQHAHFIVPVTLSSLKMLSKNYQTRFVEDLELEVTTKALARGFNEFTSGVDLTSHHEVELVLLYHNWHDNIENSIRNNNYKRGVPASVYSTNWVRAAITAKVTDDTLPISIPLTSRNLVTELLIVARSKANNAPIENLKRRKSDYTIFDHSTLEYTVELTGSGKTIWSGSSHELLGPDTADYDLNDRRLAGGDAAYGGMPNLMASRVTAGRAVENTTFLNGTSTTLTNQQSVTQCGVDFSFGDNMAVMRFGFQTTDEFYSGGIALQTISNPTIRITPRAPQTGTVFGDQQKWTVHELEFDVYVKHANLVRIDSDTGAVTRTLDV